MWCLKLCENLKKSSFLLFPPGGRFIYFVLYFNNLYIYLFHKWFYNCLRYPLYSTVWMPIKICSVDRWGFLDGATEVTIYRCLPAALTIVAKKKLSHPQIAATGQSQKGKLCWCREGLVFSESALLAKQKLLLCQFWNELISRRPILGELFFPSFSIIFFSQ